MKEYGFSVYKWGWIFSLFKNYVLVSKKIFKFFKNPSKSETFFCKKQKITDAILATQMKKDIIAKVSHKRRCFHLNKAKEKDFHWK